MPIANVGNIQIAKKNQMSPSISGNVLNNYDTKIGKFSKIGLQDEGCPPGMYAAYHTTTKDRIFRGARAIITLENPSVELGQYSMAQIWVQKGQYNGLESIQAGWAVDPALYGDSRTRLTTYWTLDNFGDTGFFNAECPGFVQVHPRIHDPGSPNLNISIFSSTTIHYHRYDSPGNTLSIKDIGPGIFSLSRYFQFGGEVYRNINKPCPPMGNGRFPNNNISETSYIAQMQYVTQEYNIRNTESAIMDTYTSNVGYKVVNWGNQGGNMRKTITYGGPGGNCD
ncbi:hypothetical protein SO802_034485 [Lithocarpus litseifolius]|uniref:Neprosin PEP catalytic domain-containing protein n=1 Tax=Lithocarpus litseifolius TaxID=425828 RepID=A0AAW2BLN0_9ROSI